MKSLGLAFFNDINLTVIGLILFLSVFVIHVCIQYFVKTDAQIEFESHIPFSGEEK